MQKSVLKRALGLGTAVVEGGQNRGRIHNRHRQAAQGGAQAPGVREALRRIRRAARQALAGARARRRVRPLLRGARVFDSLEVAGLSVGKFRA